MAWLRVGDNCPTHPLMSRLLAAAGLDHQVKNEAFGVLSQLAAVSAAHLTDGVVEMGLMAQVCPGRERIILECWKAAEVATEEKLDGRPVIRLSLDDPDFLHIRRKEEVEQDRDRARDKRTPGLLPQVRLRDGDACRWCGKSVEWKDRRSARRATYDSLVKHRDSTPQTLVVACWSCNSARGGGTELTLLPAPENPIYGAATVEFINRDKWCQDHDIHIALSSPTLPMAVDAPAAQEETQDAKEDKKEETAEIPDWVTASPQEMSKLLGHQAADGAPVDQAADVEGSALDGADPHGAPVHQAADGAPVDQAADVEGSAVDGADPHGAPHDLESVLEKNLDPTQDARVTDQRPSGRDGTGRDGPGRTGTVKRPDLVMPYPPRDKRKKRKKRGSRGGRKT